MLKVVKTGALISVQDLGRHGYRQQGVATAGALDSLALRLANMLVDNSPGAAALEIMLGGAEFEFTGEGWFALTGCETGARLDGEPVHAGWRYYVQRGQRLVLRYPQSGLCAYLAVSGGINVDVLMSSRATDMQTGFGGYHGRALKSGDCLTVGPVSPTLRRSLGILLPRMGSQLRVLPGPEAAQFSESGWERFLQQRWQVSSASNRMGFRLQGEALTRSVQQDLLSHGVFPGVVQIPPGGEPIIIASEGQTTGGYPRIGVIINADLWKLGQLRPGQSVSFTPVSLPEAEQAMVRQERYLAKVALTLTHKESNIQ